MLAISNTEIIVKEATEVEVVLEEKERKIDGAAFDTPEEEQKYLSQQCSISKVPSFVQHVSVCIPNLKSTY